MMVVDYTKPHWRRASAVIAWKDINGTAHTGPTLEVSSCTVTEAITWCPAIEARLTAPFSTEFDVSVLYPAPTRFLTLTMEAGPIGSKTADPASSTTFKLVISEAEIDYAKRELAIVAHSTDVLTLGTAFGESVYFGVSTLNAFAYYLHKYLDPNGIYGISVTGGTDISLTGNVPWLPPTTGASLLQDIAQQYSRVIVANRDGTWTWKTIPQMDTPAANPHTIDPTNAIEFVSTLDGRKLLNAVYLKYANRPNWGQTTTGIYSPPGIGLRASYEDRSKLQELVSPVIVSRIFTRSRRTIDVTKSTALAHFPLRAGDWVRYRRLRATPTTERVEQVTHSLDGSMALDTIKM